MRSGRLFFLDLALGRLAVGLGVAPGLAGLGLAICLRLGGGGVAGGLVGIGGRGLVRGGGLRRRRRLGAGAAGGRQQRDRQRQQGRGEGVAAGMGHVDRSSASAPGIGGFVADRRIMPLARTLRDEPPPRT